MFHSQPYLGQLVRKIPIVVVDDDRSALSRRFIHTLDADEAISGAVRAPALDVAQGSPLGAAWTEGRVGVVMHPETCRF